MAGSMQLTERDVPLEQRLRLKKNGFDNVDRIDQVKKRSAYEEQIDDEDEEQGPKKRNKNHPLEMTSKRAVGRHRQAVEVKKKKTHDPRFDSMCGRLNEDLFGKSYAFLEEYKVRNWLLVGASSDEKILTMRLLL